MRNIEDIEIFNLVLALNLPIGNKIVVGLPLVGKLIGRKVEADIT